MTTFAKVRKRLTWMGIAHLLCLAMPYAWAGEASTVSTTDTERYLIHDYEAYVARYLVLTELEFKKHLLRYLPTDEEIKRIYPTHAASAIEKRTEIKEQILGTHKDFYTYVHTNRDEWRSLQHATLMTEADGFTPETYQAARNKGAITEDFLVRALLVQFDGWNFGTKEFIFVDGRWCYLIPFE